MDAETSQFVRLRAGNRCEYCRLRQEYSGLRFHIEHILARQHGGTDVLENLALACPECNFHKGTNLTGVDPDTGKVTPLYHPRRDRWDEHFSMAEASIVGRTIAGRATVRLLEMNTGDRLRLRRRLLRMDLLT